jgi:hypothetical protein
MPRSCDSCGVTYEAKRPSSKFCSARCRVRASSAAKSGAPADAPVIVPSAEAGLLTLTTWGELERAGRLETSVGVAALILAARLDATTTDTGSSIAALVREHRATLTEALRGAAAADPMDELRAARDRKRAAG